MPDDLAHQLSDAKRLLERRGQLREQRVGAQDELVQREYHLRRLEVTVEAITAEIDRLENPGILGVFGSLLGNKLDKLERLREEHHQIERELGEVAAVVTSLRDQVETAEREIEASGGADDRYAALLDEKERTIAARGDESSDHLAKFVEYDDWYQQELRKTRRAIEEGEAAVKRMHQVGAALSRACKGHIHTRRAPIVSAGWNALKTRGAKPSVERARQGLQRFCGGLDELDASDGTDEDVNLARLSSTLKIMSEDLEGGWENVAVYDCGAAHPIESEAREAISYLKAKLKDCERAAADAGDRKRRFVEEA